MRCMGSGHGKHLSLLVSSFPLEIRLMGRQITKGLVGADMVERICSVCQLQSVHII